MLHFVKKYIGTIKRAVLGVVQNYQEPIGHIGSNVTRTIIGKTPLAQVFRTSNISAGPADSFVLYKILGIWSI
jgi:hypothetical protein